MKYLTLQFPQKRLRHLSYLPRVNTSCYCVSPMLSEETNIFIEYSNEEIGLIFLSIRGRAFHLLVCKGSLPKRSTGIVPSLNAVAETFR